LEVVVSLPKKKKNDSSVSIGDGNTFQGDNAFGAHSTIIKDSTVSIKSEKRVYKAPKKDTTFLNAIAPYLVTRYSRKQIGIVTIVSFIASLFTIATGIKSLLPPVTDNRFSIWPFDILPIIPNYGIPIFIVGVFFLVVFIILISVVNYHNITRCDNCGRDFGYEEIGNPDEIETPTRFGYNVETIHHFRCKYCKHTKEYPEIREYDEDGNLLY
jgi:hypothetical protein